MRSSPVYWLFLGLFLFSSVPVGLAGAEETVLKDQSFVKVMMRHHSTGVMHGEEVIAQSTVVEISEFDGVVVDTQGYIVSFVGAYWSRLESPNSKFIVELSPGRTYSAELVGVDERVYVGVFRSKGAKSREIPFGKWDDSRKDLQLASRIGSDWGCTSLKVLSWAERTTLPERELKGRLCDCGSRQYARVGSIALDGKGRLLGLVSHAKQAGLSERIGNFHIIPVGVLRKSVKQVVNRGGSIHAGWLGIVNDPKETEKIRIGKVVGRSPADKGGLKVGDYILEVNGAKVGSWMELVRTLRWAGPEAEVEFCILREGKSSKLTSVLGRRPDRERQLSWALEIPKRWTLEEGPREEKKLKFYQVRAPSPVSFGFMLEPLNPQLAEYFKSPSGRGLLVRSVVEGSAASKLEFHAGDVIFEINEIRLGTTSDIKVVLDSAKDGVLFIKFVRDGEICKKTVVLP